MAEHVVEDVGLLEIIELVGAARPAAFSLAKWPDMVGFDTGKASARSPAERLPPFSISNISRLIGWESASKTESMGGLYSAFSEKPKYF